MGFLAGFTVMGYIKLWQWQWVEPPQEELSMRYGWLQLVGSVVAVSAIVVQSGSISEASRKTRAMTEVSSSSYQWKELLTDINARADAMTFQTGNVFYEILFAVVNERLPSATYLYFGLSVLTFVCGIIAISGA